MFDDLITYYMEFSLPRSSYDKNKDKKKDKVTYTEQNRNEDLGSLPKVFFHNILVCLVKVK